ncbi:helix-turn-helix domain-containing protein [Streptomyces sp. SBT349]|uniref:helix-turn-helix domain-containing protein n=1 Tax=Streptomyces sp. SBT349 TaxID=1580539 RepID=UPI000AB5FA06
MPAGDPRRGDAATRLFVDHGSANVTVADIAREAGTAVPTVYASTGGKGAVLTFSSTAPPSRPGHGQRGPRGRARRRGTDWLGNSTPGLR